MKKTKKIIGLILVFSLLVLNLQIVLAGEYIPTYNDLLNAATKLMLLDLGTTGQIQGTINAGSTFEVRVRLLLSGGETGNGIGPWTIALKYDKNLFDVVDSTGAVAVNESYTSIYDSIIPLYDSIFVQQINTTSCAINDTSTGSFVYGLNYKDNNPNWVSFDSIDKSESPQGIYPFIKVRFKVKNGVTGTGTIGIDYTNTMGNISGDTQPLDVNDSATIEGWDTLTITAQPTAPTTKNIASVAALDSINVAYGNSLPSLPTTVTVTDVDNGIHAGIGVTWDTTSYNSSNPNAYTFTGTLNTADLIAANLTQPTTPVTASVTVNVAKDIVTTAATSKTVAYGGDVGTLPTSVPVTTENGITGITANVGTWTLKEGQQAYSNTTPGSYIYEAAIESLSGDNAAKAQVPANFKATYTVTVEGQTVYTITGVVSPNQINVNYGTPVENIGLPATVAYTAHNATAGDTSGTANVSWACNGTYDSKMPGTYTFVGTISTTETLVQPSEAITATATVAVGKLTITNQTLTDAVNVAYGLNSTSLTAALPTTYTVTYSGESFTGTVDSWDFTSFDYNSPSASAQNVIANVKFSGNDLLKITPDTITVTQPVSVGSGITGITGLANGAVLPENSSKLLGVTWSNGAGTAVWSSNNSAVTVTNGVVTIGNSADVGTGDVIIKVENSLNTANFVQVSFKVGASADAFILSKDNLTSFISDANGNINLTLNFSNQESYPFTGTKWLVANIFSSEGAPIGVQAIKIPADVNVFSTTLKFSNFPVGCYVDEIRIYDKFGATEGTGIILSNKIGKNQVE